MLSFVPVIGAVARWHDGARPASRAAPEHVVDAIRAGTRYVASSPALRTVLLRAGLSTLNSQYQSTLPGWAKARGMSYYP